MDINEYSIYSAVSKNENKNQETKRKNKWRIGAPAQQSDNSIGELQQREQSEQYHMVKPAVEKSPKSMNTTLYLRFMKHHRDKSEVKHNTQQPRQPPIITPSVGVIQQQM